MRAKQLTFMLIPFGMCALIASCHSESTSNQDRNDAANAGAQAGAEMVRLPRAELGPGTPGPTTPMMNTPFITPGVLTPPMYAVEEVKIPDDEKVIGVVEGDESKAYLCSAMSLTTTHVVNDLIATQPVSITYCDQTDCARVFAGKEPGKPLALKLGGFMNSEMALRLDEVMYPQLSKDIPLADREFVRATWGEWKSKYPSTRIYVGNRDVEFRLNPETGQTTP